MVGDGLDFGEIGEAEKVQVVEKVIEIIKIAAIRVSWVDGIDFDVGLVEALREKLKNPHLRWEVGRCVY